MIRVLVFALVFFTSAACSAGPQAPEEQLLDSQDFARSGGCGDAFVYATSADDSLALTVNWSEAASRAQAEGGYEQSVSLPAPVVAVMLQSGRFLSEGFCTDVIRPDRPVIMGEVAASGGELQITVVAEPGAEPFMPLGRATLLLNDVVFEVPLDEGGTETWRIESLELRDIQVGWLPG